MILCRYFLCALNVQAVNVVKIRKITISISVVFLSTMLIAPNFVYADETKDGEVTHESATTNWPLLQASDSESKKYRGVASMDFEGFECTAFLVKPPKCTNLKSQKAIMVTNGHCTKSFDAQKLLSNISSTVPKFKFGNMLNAKESEIVEAQGTKILYSSMRQKDFAVIEINKTYGELEAQGIPAYEMAPAIIPQDITTVGRPFDDIPQSERYLRQAQCKMEKRTGVVEGDWHWPFAIAANCPARQGASGSPMFNSKGQVVGILNSGSMKPGPGSPRCVANSPCEVSPDGTTQFVPEKAYGFETGFLNSCFNKCAWDGAAKNCDLAKGEAPDLKIRKSSMQKLKVDFALPPPYTHAKYKLVPLGAGGCSDPSGYENVPIKYGRATIEQKPKLQSPEGKYQLCVLSGTADSAGKVNWDNTSKVYAHNVTLDRTAPRAKVEIKGSSLLLRTENPVDMGDVGFVGKYVSDKSDCTHQKEYKGQKGPPWKLPTSADKFFCLMAVDSAGNWQEQPLIFDSKGQVQ